MKTHPIADLFPMLAGSDADALIESMRTNGFDARHPIITLDGMILDGRNRHSAALAAGVTPTFEAFSGPDPLAYVVLANLTRRHLNESQRAMVAARIAKLGEGRPAKTTAPGGAVSQSEASALLNVGRRSVQRASTVLKLAEPELVAAVDAGAITVNSAVEVANLIPEKQLAIVNAEHPQKAAIEAVKLLKTYDVKTEKDGAKTVQTVTETPVSPSGRASDLFAKGKLKEIADEVHSLLMSGMGVSDIAKRLGVTSHQVQEVKGRLGLVKRETNPLAKVIDFADEIRSHFEMCVSNFKSSWESASAADRAEAVKQLESSIRATRQFINRLNKEANQKEAS